MKIIICKTDCEVAMEYINRFLINRDAKASTDDIRTNADLIKTIEETNRQFDYLGLSSLSLFKIAEIPDNTTDFKIIVSDSDDGYFEYLLYIVDGKIYEWNSND